MIHVDSSNFNRCHTYYTYFSLSISSESNLVNFKYVGRRTLFFVMMDLAKVNTIILDWIASKKHVAHKCHHALYYDIRKNLPCKTKQESAYVGFS